MLRPVFSFILLVFLVVNLPVMAAGQEVPAGKWWYNTKIQKNLDLSQNEIDQLDDLFAKSRRKLIKLKSEVENEQFELDQLLGKKKVDDAEVKKQFKKLEKARNKLANERLQFVVGVRNILGRDRFQQLKSNYKKWQ
ncbi:MAG: periplasmic heavy metal sensor [Deltaproteobacteria bacterium]|jgi:Spy/CpxP family protein refolding chaperone|nr:periplasmic heavy metal sensor [Deltaproteobacteria bacterium]